MPLLRLPILILAATVAASAQETVRLSPYPQKFRSFLARNDPAVPRELLENPSVPPVADLSALASASDGAVWYGTSRGLVRFDAAAPLRDRVQYLAGKRYLADDGVEQLVPDSAAGMWARTRDGIAHIELRPMTLLQKSELFEQRIAARHDRYGLVAPSHLAVAGELASSAPRDDDNDGLWTSIYAVAECFRYAVTGSPEALARARKSLEAMLFLEEVTGRRGFPARSYIRRGDPMPHDGQWHWTSDGKYYWKGDTSSDEIAGHFFAYAAAYDLLPDPALKRHIAETARRIIDHILDHGYELIDVTGKPTRWGRWSPGYLKEEPGDSPLNSLELLSFLKTAAHLTGDSRYEAEYRKVAVDMQYAARTARYTELREELNYSDEELAMLSFYNLFRYEHDETMLNRFYRPALDQWWQNIVRENCPLWSFIYSVGRPDARPDLAAAVETLYRMPVDTIEWDVRNSHRRDVAMAPGRDRQGEREALTLLPPDERPVMKWNSNPFVIDGGAGGSEEDDGAAFLLPYWMGRYHRFLEGE
ncbi:MAG: hypothetical protein U0Q18_21635 [Bryobacteraceae bacterium]